MTEKVLMAWSGGKDSALALHEIKKNTDLEIVSLLTTVNEKYDRVFMHGIRLSLLEEQAKSLNLPLFILKTPQNCSNEHYEELMENALKNFANQGVVKVVFGDIFLEDLRSYREDNLAKIGLKGLFPIWKKDTSWLANEFVRLGFKGIISCVDTQSLNSIFAGSLIDEDFFSSLPSEVDPCGENGEFHSFVFDGPIFSRPVKYQIGESVLKQNRFMFCDITH